MKAKQAMIAVFLALLIAASDVLLAQTPVGTAFTYQGQLKEAGIPADGEYDFVFRMYDNETGGVQVGGDVAIDDWPVVDGLFTLQLDFGDGVFDGDARWIEIAVRSGDGGSAYTTLSPRQLVTPSPVALYALGGPGSGGFWAANGDHIYNTNTGGVGIGIDDPTATFQVVCPADSTADHAIAGRHPDGIGVQGSSDDGYGVVGIGGGTGGIGVYGWSIGPDTVGVFGAAYFENCYAGYFNGRGYFSGDVGIRVQEPLASLDVLNWDGLPAVKGVSSGTGVYGVHNESSGTLPGVWGATDSGSSNATGVRGIVNSTSPGGYSAGVRGHNNGAAGNGIGVYGSQDGSGWGMYGYTPSGRGVYGNSVDGVGVYATSTNGRALYAETVNGTTAARFVGNVEIVSSSTGLMLIEFGEGLDYAEGFDVSDQTTISPGTVLVIDAENAGKLAVADAPYDRKVAGIAAGANGLGSAVRLGAGQYDIDVALAGRVYCNVDASYGAIQPGDLLTTSPTPGYAMKVTDHARARGAILGKAMQSLEQGEKGQILVLVTLQ